MLLISAGAVMCWPRSVPAKQGEKPIIGYLDATSAEAAAKFVAAFRDGLAEFGFIGGRDVFIEHRWAEGKFDRLPSLVAALVEEKPAVIVAATLPAAQAAKAGVPSQIPIVFAVSADPVEFGLVRSFNRPGDNITGIAQQLGELGGKRLQLLHELLPTADTIAVIANPTNPHGAPHAKSVQAAAERLGIKVEVLPVSAASELDAAFAAIRQRQIGGLLVSDDPLFRILKTKLIALAADNAVPTIHFGREFTVAGGLISYGPNFVELYKRLGALTGRILQGATPADLPVEQPNIYELVVNQKTAEALNLTVPPLIFARSDETVE
jgi:putative ABC transport system substrate-binding protein